MKEFFNDILDKNEEIINVYKPNKLKLYFGVFVGYFFASVWLFLPLILFVFLGKDESGSIIIPQQSVWWVCLIIVGVYLLTLALTMLLAKIYHKNLYFAYSNKRIIIRKGIIGVDYKSLDMAMIGAVNVNVSVLDKILRQNTGTITFGSMASPVASANAGGYGLYRFSNVEVPYEKYREVKTVIDEYKESKK